MVFQGKYKIVVREDEARDTESAFKTYTRAFFSIFSDKDKEETEVYNQIKVIDLNEEHKGKSVVIARAHT